MASGPATTPVQPEGVQGAPARPLCNPLSQQWQGDTGLVVWRSCPPHHTSLPQRWQAVSEASSQAMNVSRWVSSDAASGQDRPVWRQTHCPGLSATNCHTIQPPRGSVLVSRRMGLTVLSVLSSDELYVPRPAVDTNIAGSTLALLHNLVPPASQGRSSSKD